MPPEYVKNLNEYKDTGYLTSSLFLNSTLIFMDEIIRKVPVDNKATERLVNAGMTQRDAESWMKVFEDHHAIEDEIKRFNEVCWSDIQEINSKSDWTTFQYTEENYILTSLFTCAKIFMTISLYKNETAHVSIVGPASSGLSCGLQDVYATKKDAVEFLRSIISNWNPEKYLVLKEEIKLI